VIRCAKRSSVTGISQRRGTEGELWQPRFFDRALRAVKEYHEKVEYIHLNPVRGGLADRPQGWRWTSFNEYAGMRREEQLQRCALTIGPVRIPADPRTRLWLPLRPRLQEKRRGPQRRRSALPAPSSTHAASPNYWPTGYLGCE
jgi:hypothetical protein